MNTIHLTIAGFPIRIDDLTGSLVLPGAYSHFVDAAAPSGDPLFTLTVSAGSPPVLDGLAPVATGNNDLGEARLYRLDNGAYAVALTLGPSSGVKIMTMDATFGRAHLYVAPADPWLPRAADSMLRIMFAQAAIGRRAFLLHASVIVARGRAVLFMGRSGTGKSTHSALWRTVFPDATLLNDDNPVVRVLPDGTVEAHGSPWSGKTPCYRRLSAPVAAFVRLRQAERNVFSTLEDVDAFVAIIPGVSAIVSNKTLYDTVCTTVVHAAAAVTVGSLRCRPDAEAARLCRRNVLPPLPLNP